MEKRNKKSESENSLMSHITSLIAPQYLVLVAFLPLSAYMTINGNLPGIEILPIILSLSFAVSGFNLTNMVFDEEVDRLNKPRRPIPSGKVQKTTAHKVGIALYTIGVLFGFITSIELGVLATIFAAVSYAYSAPPLRLRNFVWGSAITGAIIYGAIPFLAAVTISTNSAYTPIFLAFYVALFIVISNTKDFEDATGEKKAGIKSIATELGEKTGAALIIAGEITLIIAMGLLSVREIIPIKYIYASLFSLLILIPSSVLFWKSVKQIEVKNKIIEKIDNEELKDTIFQAEGVTISILVAVIIPLIYGLVSVTGV